MVESSLQSTHRLCMILHMKRAAFTFFFLMFALLLSTLAGATQESHFESGTAPFVWKKVADGFEFTEGYFASLLQDETVSFEAVRIDLGLFREAVLDARDFGRKAMTAEEFVRRSGAAAAIIFLALNDVELEADEDGMVKITMDIADGSAGKAEAVEFFRRIRRPG